MRVVNHLVPIMNYNDFISRWNAFVAAERGKAQAEGVPDIADRLLLVKAPHAILDDRSLPSDIARFLVEVGLPRSCAPFLSFGDVADGPLSLVALYGAHRFSPAGAARLAQFYVIGSDCAGNPLCIDTSHDGEVVMLDHEDGFCSRTFVASSVMILAEALLLVETVPHSEFVARLRGFDPRAADECAFLPVEVSMLS